MGFAGGAHGKEPTYHCRRHKRHRFDRQVGRNPQRRAWPPTPVFLPGESHEEEPGRLQCTGLQESDMAEEPERAACRVSITIVIACVILINSETCILVTNGKESGLTQKQFWPTSSGGPSRSVFVIHVGLLKLHELIYANMRPWHLRSASSGRIRAGE